MMAGPIERWWRGVEYHDCERLGITIQRVSATTPLYARCVAVHLLTWEENRDNHNEYFDVINEAGQRLNGSAIIGQNNSISLRAIIDKPPNEAGTNFSVHTQDTINAWVGEVPGLGVIPSDRVNGFSTRWGGKEVGGQNYGHISIWVLWMIKTSAVTPPVDPPPADDCAALAEQNAELRTALTKAESDKAELGVVLAAIRDLLDGVQLWGD